MTAAEYKLRCAALGHTQAALAKVLGLARGTIACRKTGASIEAGTLVMMPQNVSGSELRAGLGAYGVNVEQGDVLRDLPPRKSRPFAVYRVV